MHGGTNDKLSECGYQVLFFFGSLQLAVVDLLCEGRYAALMVEKPETGEAAHTATQCRST